MKRKSGTILILLGLVLILSAGALAGYNLREETRAGEQAEQVLTRLVRQIPKPAFVAEDAPEIVYPDYILDPTMEMPTQWIDSYAYVGKISIPAISLEVPVMDSWSESGAKIAPCRYSGSAYEDDMVIAAHNYEPHFGALPDMRQEDLVVFTDVDGNEFHYRVLEFEVLDPSQVQEMVSGDWDLTLFTCTVGGQNRLAVRCEKIV